MIVVDTSVWIDAHRRPRGPVAATLGALLEADEVALAWPVRVELLAGISRRDRAGFTRALAGVPLIRPTDETFTRIDSWVPAAADRGHRFSLSDWVIAALAHENGGLVWSLDADFVEMERLAFVARFDG